MYVSFYNTQRVINMFVCICIDFLALSTEEDLEIISSSYEDIGVFCC